MFVVISFFDSDTSELDNIRYRAGVSTQKETIHYKQQ